MKEIDVKIKKQLTQSEIVFYDAIKNEINSQSEFYSKIASNASYESDDITMNLVNQATAYDNMSHFIDLLVEKLVKSRNNGKNSANIDFAASEQGPDAGRDGNGAKSINEEARPFD